MTRTPHGPLRTTSSYRKPAMLLVAAALVAGPVGCSAGDDGTASTAAEEPASAPSSAPVQQPEPAPAPAPAPAAPTTAAAPAVDFAMPDFVGMDLQSAQNLVQDNGVWLSVSHDLLGSRNQVLDSNWMVCDQNIAPGQRVTGDVEGGIDFGVVKREEACP